MSDEDLDTKCRNDARNGILCDQNDDDDDDEDLSDEALKMAGYTVFIKDKSESKSEEETESDYQKHLEETRARRDREELKERQERYRRIEEQERKERERKEALEAKKLKEAKRVILKKYGYAVPFFLVDRLEKDRNSKRVADKMQPLYPFAGVNDIPKAFKALCEEFPDFKDEIYRILLKSSIRQGSGQKGIVFENLLLVGTPGAGKSYFARRLCENVELPYVMFNAASTMGSSDLVGVSSGYSSRHESLMSAAVIDKGFVNPVIIIDELEKASGDRDSNSGHIHDGLLPLLEKSEAKNWFDKGINCHVDVSHCSFVMTANEIESIPEPLMSRVRSIRMEPPTPEKIAPVIRNIRREYIRDIGIDERFVQSFSMYEIEMLRDSYAEHRSLRVLTRQVTALLQLKPRYRL